MLNENFSIVIKTPPLALPCTGHQKPQINSIFELTLRSPEMTCCSQEGEVSAAQRTVVTMEVIADSQRNDTEATFFFLPLSAPLLHIPPQLCEEEHWCWWGDEEGSVRPHDAGFWRTLWQGWGAHAEHPAGAVDAARPQGQTVLPEGDHSTSLHLQDVFFY